MQSNIIELVEDFYQNRLDIYARHGIDNYANLMKMAITTKQSAEVPDDFIEHVRYANETFAKIADLMQIYCSSNELTTLANILKERDEKDRNQDDHIRKSREFWFNSAVQYQFPTSPFAVKWLIDRRFARSAEFLSRTNPDSRYLMGIVRQSANLLSFIIRDNITSDSQFYPRVRQLLLPETVEAIQNFNATVRQNYQEYHGYNLPDYMPVAYQQLIAPEVEKLGKALEKDALTKHVADDFLFAGLELTQNVIKHSNKILAYTAYYLN